MHSSLVSFYVSVGGFLSITRLTPPPVPPRAHITASKQGDQRHARTDERHKGRDPTRSFVRASPIQQIIARARTHPPTASIDPKAMRLFSISSSQQQGGGGPRCPSRDGRHPPIIVEASRSSSRSSSRRHRSNMPGQPLPPRCVRLGVVIVGGTWHWGGLLGCDRIDSRLTGTDRLPLHHPDPHTYTDWWLAWRWRPWRAWRAWPRPTTCPPRRAYVFCIALFIHPHINIKPTDRLASCPPKINPPPPPPNSPPTSAPPPSSPPPPAPAPSSVPPRSPPGLSSSRTSAAAARVP